MVQKSIGILRNVISKRELFIQMFKQIITADNTVLISLEDNKISVAGHTADDAVTLFMLGRATGIAVEQAVNNGAELSEALMQPNTVAVAYLERTGLM